MDHLLVLKEDGGSEDALERLKGFTGTVHVEVADDPVPAEAQRLQELARAAGSRGDYDEALRLFDRAHALAPKWAYPLYDAAYTQMLKGDLGAAEALYTEVDRVEPRGFFTCKTSLDCIRRERAGVLAPGFCKAFESLEWVDDAAQKRAALQEIVAKYPTYAPAWQKLSYLLDDTGQQLDAVARGLESNPDAETKSMLLVQQALVSRLRGDTYAARRILSRVVADPETPTGPKKMADLALAQLDQLDAK